MTRYGLELSAADLATIERFHRAFIAQGPALRFTCTGRAPRDYYPTLGELMTERDRSGRQASYLANEARVQVVKSLERRNLVVPVIGDHSGPNTLPRIGAVLRERRDSLSVLYASNVEDYSDPRRSLRELRASRGEIAAPHTERDHSQLVRQPRLTSRLGGGLLHDQSRANDRVVRCYYLGHDLADITPRTERGDVGRTA